MHQSSVRAAVSKTEEGVKSLNKAISEGLKQIEGIISDINGSKTRMSEIKKAILEKQQSIAGYQLKRIDQKRLPNSINRLVITAGLPFLTRQSVKRMRPNFKDWKASSI